ncbi:MAG: hypothetical protein PW791_13220 [Neorhizobium sp.]|nr:hypothetical protein [Neorhizobium sp.]
MKRYFNKRMAVLGGLAIAYLGILATYGSPLLALATWAGIVEAP